MPIDPAGPTVGDEAPAFSLPAAAGGRVALADRRGQTVVLVFYRGGW